VTLPIPPSPGASVSKPFWKETLPRLVFLALILYGFLVSIGMLGKAFQLFGGGVVDDLIESASTPLVGLFVGILATTLIQSSSTTTSLVVALVGSGAMPVATAIPMVLGANIGTSVTNTLVSLGHISRGREFYRAFSASTVHDFFNIMAVAILFPLQLLTNFLGIFSSLLAELFQKVGGLTFTSPLKIFTEPAVKAAVAALGDHPWMLMLASMVLLFGSLRYLVIILKTLVMTKVETLFELVIFKNAARAMLFGMAVTILVQSSSITTSIVVPLAGAGILTLRQIFPYTLGANVGTTVTAMLASLAVGEISAVTVAFAHLLFNLSGILLIWPIPAIREIPLALARWLANASSRSRWIPLLYVFFAFYLIPFLIILILR